MASIDPRVLATEVIRDRGLNRTYITGENSRLYFRPGMFGDATYITNLVGRLGLSDQMAIAQAVSVGNYADPERTQVAYRSLHVDPTKLNPEQQFRYAAAAALALLIARELEVEVK